MRRYTIPGVIALSMGVIVAFAGASGSPRHSERPAAVFREATTGARYAATIHAYSDAVLWNETIAWDGAAWGNQLKALALTPQPSAPTAGTHRATSQVSTRASAPVTGVCGGAGANDQFIGRESGGNPAAVNPSSGAFGCWQLLPSTAAHCGVTPSSSISQQAACAASLSPSNWTCCEGKP